MQLDKASRWPWWILEIRTSITDLLLPFSRPGLASPGGWGSIVADPPTGRQRFADARMLG
jgi:hypothetical protein